MWGSSHIHHPNPPSLSPQPHIQSRRSLVTLRRVSLSASCTKPRIVHRRIDRSRIQRADIVTGETELCVIEEVEELRAEIQTHLFARQRELLDDGEVGVDEIRPDDRNARRISQLADGRRNKAGWIDPLQLAVVRVGGVATGNLVGPIPVVAVAAVLEEGSRTGYCCRSREQEIPRRFFRSESPGNCRGGCWSRSFQSLPNCFPRPKGKS